MKEQKRKSYSGKGHDRIHIHVAITSNLKIRAKIKEPGFAAYEVTVGGVNWERGLGNEHREEIIRKAEHCLDVIKVNIDKEKDKYLDRFTDAKDERLELRKTYLKTLGFHSHNDVDFTSDVWSVYWEQIYNPDEDEWNEYLSAIYEVMEREAKAPMFQLVETFALREPLIVTVNTLPEISKWFERNIIANDVDKVIKCDLLPDKIDPFNVPIEGMCIATIPCNFISEGVPVIAALWEIKWLRPQNASSVVDFKIRPWDGDDKAQSEARIHRDGQNEDVDISKL